MDLFGFEIVRKKSDEPEKNLTSFAPPMIDDGSSIVTSSASYFGNSYLNIDGSFTTDLDAIRKYREMSVYAEIDDAIQDIVNESVSIDDEDNSVVELNLDKIKFSDGIKKKIQNEFKEVLKLLDFQNAAPDLFRRWYIDGRLFHHAIIDEKSPGKGIQELRLLDSVKIKKVVEIQKDKDKSGVDTVKLKKEYYVYNDQGFPAAANVGAAGVNQNIAGLRINPDVIIYTPSGFINQNSGSVLSYLHKAIRPSNQLRMMEDATIIYKISRAPARRIFYIDVGNLPKQKAEQYVKDIMNRYRNKVVYDASTGEMKDDKKYMSMLEDFWMPRREGGKGTEIAELPGGEGFENTANIEYFRTKLYQALGLPLSRMQGSTGFTIGRSTEISRDEVKFNKFITKLRRKFGQMLLDSVKLQLVLKKVITLQDWENIKQDIILTWNKDNFFTELKDQEVLQSRLGIVAQMDPFVGKYFTVEYIKKKVLKYTDEEVKDMAEELESDNQKWGMQGQGFDQGQNDQDLEQQDQDEQWQDPEDIENSNQQGNKNV